MRYRWTRGERHARKLTRWHRLKGEAKRAYRMRIGIRFINKYTRLVFEHNPLYDAIIDTKENE